MLLTEHKVLLFHLKQAFRCGLHLGLLSQENISMHLSNSLRLDQIRDTFVLWRGDLKMLHSILLKLDALTTFGDGHSQTFWTMSTK